MDNVVLSTKDRIKDQSCFPFLFQYFAVVLSNRWQEIATARKVFPDLQLPALLSNLASHADHAYEFQYFLPPTTSFPKVILLCSSSAHFQLKFLLFLPTSLFSLGLRHQSLSIRIVDLVQSALTQFPAAAHRPRNIKISTTPHSSAAYTLICTTFRHLLPVSLLMVMNLRLVAPASLTSHWSYEE